MCIKQVSMLCHFCLYFFCCVLDVFKTYSHKPFTGGLFLTSHVVLFCVKRSCISVAGLSYSGTLELRLND